MPPSDAVHHGCSPRSSTLKEACFQWRAGSAGWSPMPLGSRLPLSPVTSLTGYLSHWRASCCRRGCRGGMQAGSKPARAGDGCGERRRHRTGTLPGVVEGTYKSQEWQNKQWINRSIMHSDGTLRKWVEKMASGTRCRAAALCARLEDPAHLHRPDRVLHAAHVLPHVAHHHHQLARAGQAASLEQLHQAARGGQQSTLSTTFRRGLAPGRGAGPAQAVWQAKQGALHGHAVTWRGPQPPPAPRQHAGCGGPP